MTSPQAQKAFDIHSEPDKVRDAYGRNAFGQRALLARRLVEAGVPFITLYDGGWDHHTDICSTRFDKRLPPFDSTVAALIDDLDQRGLLETTLVVALGEFGRTPKIRSCRNEDARPRPLGQRHVDDVRRRRHARRTGRRRHRPQRLRGHRARALARELRLDDLPQAGHRPRQDLLHAPRPAGAPGQRPTPISELMG